LTRKTTKTDLPIPSIGWKISETSLPKKMGKPFQNVDNSPV
jgi:hypothetical protein